MKHRFEQALVRQWQTLPATRRALIRATLWGVAMLALWQLAWLPGKQRMLQAELAHVQALELAGQLQQVASAPVGGREAVRALTPAALNERALAAGLRVVGLQARANQLDVSLEGQPTAVLSWLHTLERDGAQLRSVQLQVTGAQLQVQLALELDEAWGD